MGGSIHPLARTVFAIACVPLQGLGVNGAPAARRGTLTRLKPQMIPTETSDPDVGNGSFPSFWRCPRYVRLSPNSGGKADVAALLNFVYDPGAAGHKITMPRSLPRNIFRSSHDQVHELSNHYRRVATSRGEVERHLE